ncbi:hypothetical protein L9F63_012039 [Diploptera punctata]|uniref:ubiquitinyl hydrolase 1 n=1 Tax=Diploptera punctata TaxID=6984 RepID=A0AAD8ADD5_DIPPU|nr:hypothetical protein L9F63_012039 [Diploptera punctata]
MSLVLAIGSFVLWGPTTRYKRKGQIVGLVNLGHSCFLNALLQALASCHNVMDWLSKQQYNLSKTSLTASLLKTLSILNGKEEGEDPFTPSILIQSLLNKGWIISSGEQDAHELFHIIVSTLEEEIQKPITKVCSLLDVAKCDDVREVQSDNPVQQHNYLQLRPTLSCIETRNSQTECKLKTLLPFHGLFTSQLQCVSCQHKSAVHYTTFYSLSLVLPPRVLSFIAILKSYTLTDLIENYVTNRIVNNVSCEGCGRPNTDQVKTLNFGKLPTCLCIHIARTTWEGEPTKRDDYIKFPEFLNMDPYTYNNVQLKQAAYREHAKGDENLANGSISLSPEDSRCKHHYRLAAVIVHKGSLFNGHFITYRRGIGNSYNSWYYTSDTEVNETTLNEVMQASAYILFYTRISGAIPALTVF